MVQGCMLPIEALKLNVLAAQELQNASPTMKPLQEGRSPAPRSETSFMNEYQFQTWHQDFERNQARVQLINSQGRPRRNG